MHQHAYLAEERISIYDMSVNSEKNTRKYVIDFAETCLIMDNFDQTED